MGSIRDEFCLTSTIAAPSGTVDDQLSRLFGALASQAIPAHLTDLVEQLEMARLDRCAVLAAADG